MISELKAKQASDRLKAKQANQEIRANSLERGLDGRIVMNIKDTEFGTVNSKTGKKKRTLPRSNLLRRKTKAKEKQFTDSASKYLGEVYNDYLNEMDLSTNSEGKVASKEKISQNSSDAPDAISAQLEEEIQMKIEENFRREQNALDDTDVLYSTVDRKRKKTNKREDVKEENEISSSFALTNMSRRTSSGKSSKPSSRRASRPSSRRSSRSSSRNRKTIQNSQQDNAGYGNDDLLNQSRRSSKQGRETLISSRRSSRQSAMSSRSFNRSLSSTSSEDNQIVIIVSHEPAYEDSMETMAYFDTQEDLKSSDEETVIMGSERRGSIYFDETDGEYGTWKRHKLKK